MKAAFRLLALGCLFGTAATPLAVCVHFSYPFIEPKAFWFRALVEGALAAWIAYCACEGYWRVRLSPILFAFAGVLVVLVIADAQSPVPMLAFYSRNERMEGFVAFVHLGVFLFLLTALLDTDSLQRRFLAAQVMGSVGVGVVGLLSYATYAVGTRPDTQIFSTLGNPVFLGQYAALMFWVCAWLAFGAAGRWRAFFYAAAGLNFAMVYLSQSRGAALALIAAAVVATWTAGSRRAAVWSSLAILGALGILVLVPALVPELPRVRRFTDISLADPRIGLWRYVGGLIWERPFLGWGQEGLFAAGGFARHVDRAHNLILDWLIAGGVCGLCAGLWFLKAVQRAIADVYAAEKRPFFYAFLTVYIVTDMFLFDTLTTYLALMSVAGVLSARCAQPFRRPQFDTVAVSERY